MHTKSHNLASQNSLLFLVLSIFLFSSCGNQNSQASQTTEKAAQLEMRLSDSSAILTRFNFEHFGSYDLSTWKLLPRVEQGDVILEVKTYTKDNSKINISESDMGDGMYFLVYELLNSDGKVMKTRELSFTTDSDTASERLPVTITEIVRDYTVNPPKQFERIQKTNKLYRELQPLPTAATGTWVESITEPYTYPEK